MAEQLRMKGVEPSRFVQIAVTSAVHGTVGQSRGPIARDILALDEDGKVWLYDFCTGRRKAGWGPLSMLRKSSLPTVR
jgi:hypothetical protein